MLGSLPFLLCNITENSSSRLVCFLLLGIHSLCCSVASVFKIVTKQRLWGTLSVIFNDIVPSLLKRVGPV